MPIVCMYSFAICVIRASVIRGASLGEKDSEICPTVFFSRGFNRVWSLKSCTISFTSGGMMPSASNIRDSSFIT